MWLSKSAFWVTRIGENKSVNSLGQGALSKWFRTVRSKPPSSSSPTHGLCTTLLSHPILPLLHKLSKNAESDVKDRSPQPSNIFLAMYLFWRGGFIFWILSVVLVSSSWRGDDQSTPSAGRTAIWQQPWLAVSGAGKSRHLHKLETKLKKAQCDDCPATGAIRCPRLRVQVFDAFGYVVQTLTLHNLRPKVRVSG